MQNDSPPRTDYADTEGNLTSGQDIGTHIGDAGANDVHQGSPTRLTFSPPTTRDNNTTSRRRQNAEPRLDRVLKTFKIASFDGSAQPGAIDLGVASWFRRFEALLGMQEDLHRVQLPDSMKNALLFQHLSGSARQWYIANLYDNRLRSFDSLGRALKREFGCKLSKAQIGQMVAAERKNHAETYREYSIRLRAMAAATTFDGVESPDSNNLALSSFISNAWIKHSDKLRMVIREDSNHPLQEMDRAISRLCTIAGHQGIVTSHPRPTNGLNTCKDQSGGSQRDIKFRKRDFSTARCGVCNQLGHTTGFHDRYVARQQSGMANLAHSVEDAIFPKLRQTLMMRRHHQLTNLVYSTEVRGSHCYQVRRNSILV